MKDLLVTYEKDRNKITKGDSWVYTDSLNLAKVLNQQHKRILERTRQILVDYNISTGQLKCPVNEKEEFINKHTDFTYSINYYKDTKSELRPYYKLSKDLLILIIFSFRKLEKAQQLQKAYIAEFNRKEKELHWYRARYLGIDVRNDLTDSIKEFLESPKWTDYKNFTDLVYKNLFDKNTKKIREENGLHKKANVREYLNQSDLDRVKELEKEISVLLSYGFDYHKIKFMIGNKYKLVKSDLILKTDN